MHYLDIAKRIKLHFSCSQAWCFCYSPASSSAVTQPGHALMLWVYGIAVSGLWGSVWLLSGAQQKEMKQTFALLEANPSSVSAGNCRMTQERLWSWWKKRSSGPYYLTSSKWLWPENTDCHNDTGQGIQHLLLPQEGNPCTVCLILYWRYYNNAT